MKRKCGCDYFSPGRRCCRCIITNDNNNDNNNKHTPDKYYPLPTLRKCVFVLCGVFATCYFSLTRYRPEGFLSQGFYGVLRTNPLHTRLKVFLEKTPRRYMAGYYRRPVCLYSYIHSPLFCIFRFEFDDSRLCYLFKWGFNFRKSFFFLNCSMALFCTSSHYKRKQK